MGNKKYCKGYRFEREIVNEARKNNYIAFRSAGSHSPVDVVIIDTFLKKAQFIQCKSGKISERKLLEIEEKFNKLRGYYIIDFKVMHKK